MSEEDDWFERALRDLDEESDGSESVDQTDVADTGEASEDGREAVESDDPGTVESDDPGTADTGRREAMEDVNDRGESGEQDVFGSGTFGQEDLPGGGSFGDDEPVGSGSVEETGSFDETDRFGGGDPFGGESGDRSETPETNAPDSGGSVDPFGGYRGSSTPPAGDFGFDDLDGGDSGGDLTGFDVDPEEFESAIERTNIGIEGLDEMILGGVPRRSLLSVIGGAGTGKTTFALQFLYEALESERNCVYITLEQTRKSILSTAEEKGWSFREHADAGRLAVVAIDPIEMANSLASIRNDLIRLIAEFDADRLVLDSVSLLEMMYDHPAKRRSEVFGFTRSLKEAGVTTLLASEASETNPYASRHGIVEYLTDAVFVLQYVRGSDFRETRLAVEIQKIRDANHSREMKPYEITDTGISVYGQANIF